MLTTNQYNSKNQNNMSTHLTIKNENRPNPRTATPEKKKGLLPLNKKMNFAPLFVMMLPHSKHAAYFHEITS